MFIPVIMKNVQVYMYANKRFSLTGRNELFIVIFVYIYTYMI